jgi:hypothetical protein
LEPDDVHGPAYLESLRQALGTIDARDVRSTNSLRQHELEVTLTECLIFSDACNGTVMRKSKLPFSLQDCLDTSKSIKSADIWQVAFTTDLGPCEQTIHGAWRRNDSLVHRSGFQAWDCTTGPNEQWKQCLPIRQRIRANDCASCNTYRGYKLADRSCKLQAVAERQRPAASAPAPSKPKLDVILEFLAGSVQPVRSSEKLYNKMKLVGKAFILLRVAI